MTSTDRGAKTGGLSLKRARFVREYLIDLNATQAAKRAGYSAKTASSQGERLLRNADVIRAVEGGTVAKIAKSDITQERVLAELAILAFSDVRHFTTDDDGNLLLAKGAPDTAWRAVSSVKHRITKGGSSDAGWTTHEIEFKLWDKPGPLKLAGLHSGLKFIERREVTGADGGPVEVLTRIERVIVDAKNAED